MGCGTCRVGWRGSHGKEVTHSPEAVRPAGCGSCANCYEDEASPLSWLPLHLCCAGSPGSKVDKPDMVPTFMELNSEGGKLFRARVEVCVCVWCVWCQILLACSVPSLWPIFFLCTWENTEGAGSLVKGARWSICVSVPVFSCHPWLWYNGVTVGSFMVKRFLWWWSGSTTLFSRWENPGPQTHPWVTYPERWQQRQT